MDQSRACKFQKAEQEKRAKLLEEIEDEQDEDQEAPLFVYEDNATNKVDISSVIYCKNPIVEASLRALCTLVDKANILVNISNEKFWPLLVLAGDSVMTTTNPEEKSKILAQTIRFIGEIFDMLTEAFMLFRNIIQQMRVVREMDAETLSIAKQLEFHKVWRILGDLLAVFIHADEILLSRPDLRTSFVETNDYLNEQFQTKSKLPDYGVTEDSVDFIINRLREYETAVMSGNSFRFACQQTLGDLDTNERFAREMAETLKTMYLKWEQSTTDETPDKRQIIAITALSAYHYIHFANNADKKLLTTVFRSHKKVGSILLLMDLVFVPCIFLIREIGDGSFFENKSLNVVLNIRDDLKSGAHAEGMLKEAHVLTQETRIWIKKIEEKVQERKKRTASINFAKVCLEISDLFLKGVSLADKMSRLLRCSLKAYSTSKTSKLAKSDAYQIFDIVEAIKNISFVLEEHWRHILEATSLASQQWRCHLIQVVEEARNALEKSTHPPKHIAERDSALCVARDALLYTASRGRMVIVRNALEFGGAESILRSAERRQMKDLIVRLMNLIEPRILAAKVTNCAFLVHTKSLIGIYWDTVLDRRPKVDEIRRFCSAIGDCIELWRKKRHWARVGTPDWEYFEYMRKGFLSPLCCKIENDLRFLTHRHLEMDEREEMDDEEAEYIISLFIKPTYRMYDQIVDIDEFLTRYLERIFYNLTIIAPHDAKTYAEMIEIANMKYNLKLISGNMPLGGVDESCNIIELTGNLAQVVVNYNFSLGMQYFVEKQSPNKQLHVISRNDMIISLRKYGVGVLPSAMNVAYQVLRKKLNTFNLFMSDDHIRALLETDIRQFEANKLAESWEDYPMEAAEKFSKQIARIGGTVIGGNGERSRGGSAKSGMTNEDDVQPTYVDKFRMLITQIGNALSFVQLMTSAAKCVETELGDTLTSDVQRLFANLVIGGLEVEEEEGKEGGENRQEMDVVRRLRMEYTALTAKKRNNFNQLFVDVFRNTFSVREEDDEEVKNEEGREGEAEKKPRQNFSHLKNFYIIVPALTLSQVEHMRTCRNRIRQPIASQNKELTYTDDGFSVGIAYILSVLDLWPKFESLNWYSSVFETLNKDSEEATEMAKNSKGAQLKAARLDMMTSEFQQLYFTTESAKVYFIDDEQDGADNDEYDLF